MARAKNAATIGGNGGKQGPRSLESIKEDMKDGIIKSVLNPTQSSIDETLIAAFKGVVIERTEREKFPNFMPARKFSSPKIPKSKSLNHAEMTAATITDEALAEEFLKLKTDPPPLSLQEARAQRQSIKDLRRSAVSFLKNRTASRLSAQGRVSAERQSYSKSSFARSSFNFALRR